MITYRCVPLDWHCYWQLAISYQNAANLLVLQVDVAILEVGLGGRLDATNVVSSMINSMI